MWATTGLLMTKDLLHSTRYLCPVALGAKMTVMRRCISNISSCWQEAEAEPRKDRVSGYVEFSPAGNLWEA